MATLLLFSPILCYVASFLLFAQNANSLTNNTNHYYHHDLQDHRAYRAHQKPSKKFRGATNVANFSKERRDYQMRITGGLVTFTTILYKHVVSIRTAEATAYFGDNHICVGSIISDNLILTAAHCVVDRRKIITREHRLTVIAGTPNRLIEYATTVEMKILDVIPHHQFVRGGPHDIALLRLDGSFPDDNDLIKVIPLYEEIIPNGTQCEIIGWGQMFYRGPFSAFPVQGTVTVFSSDYCLQFYPDLFDETMICAGNKDIWDVDVCRGDSGGPLICDHRVAAIVSGSSYCGREKKPTVFASVYHHSNWIKSESGAKVVKPLKSLHLFVFHIFYAYIFLPEMRWQQLLT